MVIKDVNFIGSYDRESTCPKESIPEFAFIGRSNVGKSSLINMLTGRKEIARVSKMPGKTQLLNYFMVNDSWYLVDLPGYGYAKISKKKREKWESMIEQYLINRRSLMTAFVLLDSRIPLQDIDLEFINWLGERAIPYNIIFTKIDKVKKGVRESNLTAIRNGLLQYWNLLPDDFVSSAEVGDGRETILSYIEELIANSDT